MHARRLQSTCKILVGLLTALVGAYTLSCPRYEPDGSSPKCSECVGCVVPKGTPTHTLSVAAGAATAGVVLFEDAVSSDGAGLARFREEGGNVKATLLMQPDRADIYRWFGIYNKDMSKHVYYWLSGNNKGNGSVCQIQLPYRWPDFSTSIEVVEFGPVPNTQCF